jgi:TonB family protein
MRQNRCHVRRLVTPRLYVAMNGYSAGGILYDIGLGGLALDVVGPKPAGERVLLDFDMSETGEQFEGTGRIIWKSDSGSRVGIQFVDLPESSHLKIRSWLSAKSISGDALQNVVVQDRMDTTFMEYSAWRERVTSPTTSAVLEPPENEQPSVSVPTDSLPLGTPPVALASEQRSNAKLPPESDDRTARDWRSAFSQLLAAESKIEHEIAPEKAPQDWKHIRQYMATAAVVFLAVLLLAATIRISTPPEFNIGATYQALKSMVARGAAKSRSSSAPAYIAQPSVSETSRHPSKAPVNKETTENARAGPGANNSSPPNDQFEVMDAQHGRRYFPRTSTSVIVQFERRQKLEPGNTPANRNSAPDSVSLGPVLVSQVNAGASDQIGPHESSSQFGRVLRESSGEPPIMETMPEYPTFALRTSVQGRVVLTAIITKDGGLEDVRILSSPSVLDATVLDAVRTWRYQPHYENGAPVEVVTAIIVDFSITTK